MTRLAVTVTPLMDNQAVRVALVLAVSAVATAHAFLVSIPLAVVARWRSR